MCQNLNVTPSQIYLRYNILPTVGRTNAQLVKQNFYKYDKVEAQESLTLTRTDCCTTLIPKFKAAFTATFHFILNLIKEKKYVLPARGIIFLPVIKKCYTGKLQGH